jgi:uncharacterized RDD family membrane protein YckC
MRWRKIKKNQHQTTPERPSVRYAGFWSRSMGFITDLFMIGLPVSLVFMILFGYDEMKKAGAMDVIIQSENAVTNAPDPMISIAQLLLSMAVYVAFWRITQQTPGKKMAKTQVVDAKTFERASILQLSVRFLGYFISALFLFLGFFSGLLRKDGRTLHDLISRTAVIYDPNPPAD